MHRILAYRPRLQLFISRFYKFFRRFETNPKKDVDRFLFIVGSGRSGNTLLRKLMMDELDIFIPPETYVLPSLSKYFIFKKTTPLSRIELFCGTFQGHKESWLLGDIDYKMIEIQLREENLFYLDECTFSFYKKLAHFQCVDATWYGDKTPLNTLYLGFLSENFPNAKFVYLQRDAVDVVSSYLKAGIYKSVNQAMLRWLSSARCWSKFKSKIDENNYIEITYEDLVNDPNQQIQRIKEKFNIPYRTREYQLNLGDVQVYIHHKNVNNKVNSNSIGNGYKHLTEKEITYIRGKLRKSL